MGVRILVGNLDGTKDIDGACLYDSVTMTAFGPIFDDEEEVEAFLQAYERTCAADLRVLSSGELEEVVSKWREGRQT